MCVRTKDRQRQRERAKQCVHVFFHDLIQYELKLKGLFLLCHCVGMLGTVLP